MLFDSAFIGHSRFLVRETYRTAIWPLDKARNNIFCHCPPLNMILLAFLRPVIELTPVTTTVSTKSPQSILSQKRDTLVFARYRSPIELVSLRVGAV